MGAPTVVRLFLTAILLGLISMVLYVFRMHLVPTFSAENRCLNNHPQPWDDFKQDKVTKSNNDQQSLSIFIITNFYAFIEQTVDDEKITYRYKALKYFTSENVRLIKEKTNEPIEWVIITQPAYKQMFNWTDLATVAIVETNPFPKRQKFKFDEYELDRGGKYPFLRNRLPHLTFNLDSDDCMHFDYVRQVLDHAKNTTDELHLFYTGSVNTYSPCSGGGSFTDRFTAEESDRDGTENFSMGLALFNNSTNNILNVALYGHGGPPERFPHMGYIYGVTGINLPGLYIQTPFSHSRGNRVKDDCEFTRLPKYNGIYWGGQGEERKSD